jgi:hypothetical protein
MTMAAPKKGKIPPQFLKAKKAAAPMPGKGAKIVDPKGKAGTVTAVAGQIAKVRHADGSTDTHPVGALKKAAAAKTAVKKGK